MQDIFARGKEAYYVRGDDIPVANNVHYIKSGSVGLYSCEPDKKSFLFAYKKGEIFPYIPLKPRLVSGRKLQYRCLSAVSTLAIPRKSFEASAFQPENIQQFVRNLMEIMEMQIERIDNLEQGQVQTRLLERLRFFAHRLGEVHGDKIVIESPMSHADIASSIGTSRETVNRFMRQLEKKGTITVRRQTIIINSIKSLDDMLLQDNDIAGEGKNKKLLATASLAAIVAYAAASQLPSGF